MVPPALQASLTTELESRVAPNALNVHLAISATHEGLKHPLGSVQQVISAQAVLSFPIRKMKPKVVASVLLGITALKAHHSLCNVL